MISYIKGVVDKICADYVIVENGGIGYRIFVPFDTVSARLSEGDTVKLHTYMNIREDAIQLYGFLNMSDLELFVLLIGVSGIGPKGAISILSAVGADNLRIAVAASDANAISKAPGIGKKTAQKLILELKDRLEYDICAPEGVSDNVTLKGDAISEAIQALTVLGISASDAAGAVSKIKGASEMTTEEILKAALKTL